MEEQQRVYVRKKEKKEKNRNSLVAIKFLFSNNRAPQLMRLRGCRDDDNMVVVIIIMMMMAITRQGWGRAYVYYTFFTKSGPRVNILYK